MQKKSWASLAPSYKRYAYTTEVGAFVACVVRELNPLALFLFGSLARGDYHERSDADVCLILAQAPRTPFEGYDLAVACDPSGVVQPLVYGADQFRQMVADANGLALEVLADGIFLAGDSSYFQEIETLGRTTREKFRIERTPTGWRLRALEKIDQAEMQTALSKE